MSPRSFLRLEGALVLCAAALGYALLGASWWLFFALLLVPDVFMAGYLFGPRVGALLYNAGHTYALPIVLGAGGAGLGSPLLGAIALIWTAHIGLDRALGYGLKHASGFRDTHLGPSAADSSSAADPTKQGSGPNSRTRVRSAAPPASV
jgi:hypothetical protein